MSPKKPLIFVTNDDGIFSKGIRSLVEAVLPFGDVVVLAPDSPQSGMGHAITVNDLLRMQKSIVFDKIEAYTCSGTPVDCVKLGIYELLKRKPDLLVSGINHGENTSTNVLYSGTMSAAVEGAMEGIPSIGFSLADFDSDADFSTAQEVVRLGDEAIDLMVKNDWLTVPPLAIETWRTSMISAERQRVSPFFLGGEVIQIAYPTSEMSHEDKMMSMRGNNPHFSRATVQHELIPGHHLQQFMNQRYMTHRRPFGTQFWT
jgi:hypothetical protein